MPTIQYAHVPSSEINFYNEDGEKVLYAPPLTKMEMYDELDSLFGMKMGYKTACPNHTTPMDMFWKAWTAEHPVILYKAARSIGKTKLMASLALMSILCGVEALVVSGSLAQSQLLYEEVNKILFRDGEYEGQPITNPFVRHILEHTKTELVLVGDGGRLRVRSGSEKAVRGPRAQRILMDEADEMDRKTLNAALGIPVPDPRGKIPTQIFVASTHQHANGTMTELLTDIQQGELNWPVFESCWRECLVENGGYKTMEDIEERKASVPLLMWNTEFEMMEPVLEGRIFTPEHIDNFAPVPADGLNMIREGEETFGEELIFEAPVHGGKYVTGVDWAKSQDYTVIVTFRTDTNPVKIVAYRRVQAPYDVLAAQSDIRANMYASPVYADGIGVGSAAIDQMTTDQEIERIIVQGFERQSMYNDYINAVQKERIISPYIPSLVADHKYFCVEDLTPSGHIPDSVAACAMAWKYVEGNKDRISISSVKRRLGSKRRKRRKRRG